MAQTLLKQPLRQRAVLRYPGAKWRIADFILRHMPQHHSYLEPFFEFSKLDFPLVGTGGTITSLALIAQNLSAYDEAKIHGYLLSQEKLEMLANAMQKDSTIFSPLPKKRQDILPQGLAILQAMMTILGKTSLLVSTRDGLYGLQNDKL